MRFTDLGDAPSPVEAGTPARLARLRPEYAALYNGLDAGAWYPAASLAAYFRAWLSRHPGPARRETPWISGRSPDERQS